MKEILNHFLPKNITKKKCQKVYEEEEEVASSTI